MSGYRNRQAPIPFIDSATVIEGSGDQTKQVRFEVDGITTGTVRVVTVPDADITLSGSASALTSGRIPFATTGGLLTDSSSLTWNDTTKQMVVTQETLTASSPFISHTATWNNAGGTFVGIFSNITNTASGASSLLMELQVGGVDFFTVSKGGTMTAVGNAVIGAAGTYNFSGRSKLSSSADGILTLSDTAGTAFSRLTLGGTTSSYPSIKRNSAALNFRLADDSADAAITSGSITASGALLPSANDVAAIGVSGTAWADLFLASGGVIDWNSGDVTLSNSAANRLRYTGTSSVGAETGGFCIADEGTVAKCLFAGYDIGSDYAFLQGIQFGVASKSLMLNTTGGAVTIGTNGAVLGGKLDVLGADNSTAIWCKINASSANITASDTFIGFYSTDGLIGSIAGTAVSGVIIYNTFTGGHYSQGDLQKEILTKEREVSTYFDSDTKQRKSRMEQFDSYKSDVPVGTILSSIDELCEWPNEPNITLPKCKITDKKEDKAVYGVFGGIDDEGDIQVLGLGTGIVRVNNENGSIEVGDFICSSSTPGVGMRYDGDDMRVVVCKARQSYKGKKEATIACTILAG